MIGLQLAGFLILYAGCVVGPGLLVVRRLDWEPLEKLCAALGISLVILYLLNFALFAVRLPASSRVGVTLLCFVSTSLAARDCRSLLADPLVRKVLFWFIALAAWCLMVLGLVRNIAGGTWAGDWIEHYQRTCFFLGEYRVDFRFIDLYLLPARLPLMNVVCSFFLAQLGDGYEVYQIVSMGLNLLVFFPCCLFVRWFDRGGPVLVALTGLLAFNPSFMQNLAFTWTKQLGAFYALFALWLYIQGWRRESFSRLVLAFVSLAAGCLTHHYVGIFTIFFTAHYLMYLFWQRQRKWLELATIAATCSALLATWFAWSLAVYGTRGTFFSNYVFLDYERSIRAEKDYSVVPNNLYCTLVPFPLHGQAPPQRLKQDNPLGWVRDYWFMMYQMNLLPMMGSVGGPVVIYLLLRKLLARPCGISRAETCFWALFLTLVPLVAPVLGFEFSPYGWAHASLQPLTLLGVVFLAANFFTLARGLRWLLLLGCTLDFALGVFLHFSLNHEVFARVSQHGKDVDYNQIGLSMQAFMNWRAKEANNFVFWGDYLVPCARWIQGAMIATFLGWLAFMAFPRAR